MLIAASVFRCRLFWHARRNCEKAARAFSKWPCCDHSSSMDPFNWIKWANFVKHFNFLKWIPFLGTLGVRRPITRGNGVFIAPRFDLIITQFRTVRNKNVRDIDRTCSSRWLASPCWVFCFSAENRMPARERTYLIHSCYEKQNFTGNKKESV